MVVSIVNGVQKFSRLRKERSDFTIVPTREDRFTVAGEEDTVAFESWDFDSQEFLSSFGVPNSNVIQRAGSEELRVTTWEANIINSFVMASVSQFWSDIIGVTPVDSSFGCSAEEVS